MDKEINMKQQNINQDFPFVVMVASIQLYILKYLITVASIYLFPTLHNEVLKWRTKNNR